MQVKKQQLELDMEQWTGSKLGKEYILNLNKLWEVMKKAGTLHAAVHGVAKSRTGLSNELNCTSEAVVISPSNLNFQLVNHPAWHFA